MSYIYKYSPEFNYWFNNYWTEYGEIVTEYLKLPQLEEEIDYPNNSFLELLFNNNYYNDDTNNKYNYLFKSIYDSSVGKSTLRRIKSVSNLTTCYITDISGTYDIFNISDSSYNLLMLDNLYDFRMGYLNDLSNIDSSSLDTVLSRLIYDYLDFNLNDNFINVNRSIVDSSNSNLLDNAFEIYLNNEVHRTVRLWTNFTDNEVVHLSPIRKSFILIDDNTSILSSYELTIDDVPYNTDKVYIRKNGDFLKPEFYTKTFDSSSFNITFDSEVNLQENDILLIDYYKNTE